VRHRSGIGRDTARLHRIESPDPAVRSAEPLAAGNIRNRVLHPLLAKLGIPKAGLHAFRHSRVTLLRKNGTPPDLQKLWLGRSSLRTTDRYAHTDQELEYRQREASRVGLDLIVGPNLANWTQSASEGENPQRQLCERDQVARPAGLDHARAERERSAA
jgi:hypothetical protein